MSLITLINGLICLITGIMFYFYIYEFKTDLSKNRTITYFIFGAYFVFNGFIRIKMALLGDIFNFHDLDIYNNSHMFTLLSFLSNIIFGIFIFNSIKQEKKNVNTNLKI